MSQNYPQINLFPWGEKQNCCDEQGLHAGLSSCPETPHAILEMKVPTGPTMAQAMLCGPQQVFAKEVSLQQKKPSWLIESLTIGEAWIRP